MMSDLGGEALHQIIYMVYFYASDEVFDLEISGHAKLILLNLCRRADKMVVVSLQGKLLSKTVVYPKERLIKL